MWRPLFKEPDDELEREDEWSEPKGFLIGGWALYTKREIAQQYFDAANILVEAIERNQWEDYKLAFPVLYLYRHMLELMLKAIVNSRTPTHDIGELMSDVEALVQARYGQPLPAWIGTWLREISVRDSNSTTYRYGEVYDKASKSYGPVPGEEHVELRNLQEAMEATYRVLSRLLDEIQPVERR
jgi:hypothetical protein